MNKPRINNRCMVVNILLVIFVLLLALFFIRLFSAKHLDDVSPEIPCDEGLLEKADIFYVIPKFNNINISDNPGWCKKILSYNKTLAMHGVYHTYNEFATVRNKNYIVKGAEEFEKCFGFYPDRFKAPQVNLSSGNKKLLELEGYEVDTIFTDVFHKVYHCDDKGFYHNWVSDLI